MQKIAVVIPCYNEAGRLKKDEIIGFLRADPDISFLLVNDGSTDTTARIIEEISSALPAQIRTLHIERNSGKARAVRTGMLWLCDHCDAQWLGYWDADLAIPLSEIRHFLSHAQDKTVMLMGARLKRLGADVNRGLPRFIIGRAMATFISIALKLGVYDTQCGAKLIHRKIVREVFSEKFVSRWLFDVEIIARIIVFCPQYRPNECICEVPVCAWRDVKGSKLGFYQMLCSLVDLAKIKYIYFRRSVKKDLKS